MFKSQIIEQLEISKSTFCRRIKILCQDEDTPFKYERIRTMKFIPLRFANYILENL